MNLGLMKLLLAIFFNTLQIRSLLSRLASSLNNHTLTDFDASMSVTSVLQGNQTTLKFRSLYSRLSLPQKDAINRRLYG